MITLRLDPEMEKQVELYSKIKGISKSELVRESICEYLDTRLKPSLFEAGKEYFEKYELDDEDLSNNSEDILRRRFSDEKNTD